MSGEKKMLDDADRVRIRQKMERLALSFPILIDKPGVFPWDPDVFDEWAATGEANHEERLAARFVLAVWDPGVEWKAGRFGVMEALRVWDREERAAFVAWAND